MDYQDFDYYCGESRQSSFSRIPACNQRTLLSVIHRCQAVIWTPAGPHGATKNGWQDEAGRVYIYYPLERMQNNLRCAMQKIGVVAGTITRTVWPSSLRMTALKPSSAPLSGLPAARVRLPRWRLTAVSCPGPACTTSPSSRGWPGSSTAAWRSLSLGRPRKCGNDGINLKLPG